MDKPAFDPSTQQYKPVTPPSAVALDTPPRVDRTVGKPRREQFPSGMEGMRLYQKAVSDHSRTSPGGGDRGKEQREALGGA